MTSKNELMHIEIKFGKGKSDTVLVNLGDDPNHLAQQFVLKHELKKSFVAIISQYLSNTINEFISNNPEIGNLFMT